jgi:hypothetical protein
MAGLTTSGVYIFSDSIDATYLLRRVKEDFNEAIAKFLNGGPKEEDKLHGAGDQFACTSFVHCKCTKGQRKSQVQ